MGLALGPEDLSPALVRKVVRHGGKDSFEEASVDLREDVGIDIERIWKYVKGAAVANHDFGNVRSLREAVKLAFQGLNESQEGGLTLSFRDPSARDLGKAA